MADTSVLVTPLCDRLGIQLPIVQAPIGSAATPELVAAVADAGGLGMLALTWVTEGQAVNRIRRRAWACRRAGAGRAGRLVG